MENGIEEKNFIDKTNRFLQNGVKWKDNSPFEDVINKEINISNIFKSNKIFFDNKENNEKLVEEWNDESLLSEIITKEYEKEGKDPTKSLKLLEEQELKKLKEWKSLLETEKAIFSLGLRKILDEVSGIKKRK